MRQQKDQLHETQKNLDQRNIVNMLIKIFSKPERRLYGSSEIVIAYTYLGMGKRMPDGSWRDRKRIRLYLKSANSEAAEQMMRCSQWDYVEVEGFLGTWITQTQWGEKADPCLVVRRIAAIPQTTAEMKFQAAKGELQRVV